VLAIGILLQSVRNSSRETKVALGAFITLYVLALIIRMLFSPLDALIYVGIDIGLGTLILQTWWFSRKRDDPEPAISQPFLELAIGLLLYNALWRIVPNIPIEEWRAGLILKKNLIDVVSICVFISFRKSVIWNLRASLRNLKKDVALALIIFLGLMIPSAFYSGTAQGLLSGTIEWTSVPTLFGVGFVFSVLLAALPEEFLYRGFIQSRLSSGLRSEWAGLLITSIYFGLLHTRGNLSWGYGENLADAFAESIFIQTFMALLFGMLYMRTKSLVPGIILHAASNALNNFADTAQRLG
jgi:uncharacterized protein